MLMIKLKRIYEERDEGDGFRILVDRLWPRGISRERAALDLWLKDIAPSPGLREWFGHDPAKWDEFRKQYKKELRDKSELVNGLKNLESIHKAVTLLYGARDTQHNAARVLAQVLAAEGTGD